MPVTRAENAVRRVPRIAADATVDDAQAMLLRLDARWLCVHENGAILGTVDIEQTHLDKAGAGVRAVLQGGEGVIRWLA